MAYEELFNRLLRSESEDEVTASLESYGFAKHSSDAWQPYGGIDNNFGIIGAQQADALGALVEKIVNSIDAVLMRECHARNLDPRSNLVPRSMSDAAERFLDVPDGNLAKLSSLDRTQLAEKSINVVVTGNKPSSGNPCVMVIDSGEGQLASAFPNTLLSLLKSNKSSVPFVQGKFNMGSTGSLTYCSPNKNYQLIASRRHTSILDSVGASWAFTVVRKRPPLNNEKNERYEYLAPRGRIIDLGLKEVLVLPDGEGKPYARAHECGTVVKLYEYDLPGSTRTMATADFFRSLSNKLWTVVVPVRIIETREYRGHTLATTLAGMNIRLEDDKGEVLEDGFPCNFTLNVPSVGVVDGRICLFKKKAEISRWVHSREAIIYTINGQSHGSLSNDFFRRQSVGLPWIQKQLLVNVDCSRLDAQLVNRLFMTSRDRQRDVREKEMLENSLAEFLRKHPGLREWNERRHREVVDEQFGDESNSIELFEKLVSQNPALAEILGIGGKVKVHRPGEITTEKFTGQKFPTFLKVEGAGADSLLLKKCALNSFCRVTLLTDAENDYLERAFEPGRLIVAPNRLLKSSSLYNGRLEMQFSASPESIVGNREIVKVMLTSPNAPEGCFEVSLSVEFEPPAETKKAPAGERRPPRVSGLSLPEIREVSKDSWSSDIEIENDQDVVKIMKEEQGTTSLVNMDNVHYRRYVYSNPKREQEIRNLFMISSTIMGLWLVEQVEKGAVSDEHRRSVSNSLGRLMLPLIDSLGGKIASLEGGPR